MFSEYASRFLAPSQLLDASTTRNLLERRRDHAARASSRNAPGRPPFGSTFHASRLPFGSRLAPAPTPAPLFHSTHDEFREEDDGEEHEREVADFYALQKSRMDFTASRSTDSSDSDGEAGRRAKRKAAEEAKRGKGIRSSWTGEDSTSNIAGPSASRSAIGDSRFGATGARDQMVSINLQSTIHEDDEPFEGPELSTELTEDTESDQLLRKGDTPAPRPSGRDFIPGETDAATMAAHPRPPSPDSDSVPPEVGISSPEPPRHDAFWSTLFLTCLAAVFATFLLVCLHTSAPNKGGMLGDTVYSTLHSSFYLLAVDTLVAVIVAFLWMAVLRSFVRPLVLGILVAVPVITISFSLYSFVSSFNGSWHGASIQDRAMRGLSFVPGVFAILWMYTAYKARHSLGKAIQLLEFATKILAANTPLIVVGFADLVGLVVWTWVWMLMFTRVFLGGHLTSSKSKLFIIDTGTWWLGVFFILTYLWSLGVAAGLQRATTAATVSQWYFHRLAVPAVSPQRVVQASLSHALTTIFGTICLSTLLALAVRLPLLVLPRRISGWITFCFYQLIPTSIATLTNPLTLTYAAIHSQPLSLAARGLSEMTFIAATSPTTTLTPSLASQAGSSRQPIYAYRLAKLLLHATRIMTSLAFGFGGWVSTARMLQVEGSSVRGSLYAYIVGFIAGAIGWAVLGAMEGVLSGILDAIVVCYGSEIGRGGTGQARYCREAAELLGGDGEVGL